MTETSVHLRLQNFIMHNFLFGDQAAVPSNSASLLENGIIDSTGVLDLVMFLEEEFHICVDDEDVTPENFDSINNMAVYAQKKLITHIA